MRRLVTLLLVGAVVASSAVIALAADWSSGFYVGKGKKGNVCIAFEVRGKKVTRLEIKRAPDCAHRFRCTGRSDRSGPGAFAANIRIKRNGHFHYESDLTVQPPRPGPPPRRFATTVTGELKGRKASGTFRTLYEAGAGGQCDSGVLTWKARRVKKNPGLPPIRDRSPDSERPPSSAPRPPAEDPLLAPLSR